MYYLGIDVHKRDSYIAVLNEAGEVIEEARVFDANLDEFAQQYAGSNGAIEATSNYDTIYDALDEHLDVVVADPSQIKAIRERRALVRGHKWLVEKYTDFENEVHVVLDKHGISYDGDPFSRDGR